MEFRTYTAMGLGLGLGMLDVVPPPMPVPVPVVPDEALWLEDESAPFVTEDLAYFFVTEDG